MSHETIDAERLAALLDGRLDARERAAVLAELAVAPEDAEVLADAIAALPPAAGGVVQLESASARPAHRAWRRGWPVWAAAAAVLLIVAVPTLRTRDGAAPVDPTSAASALEDGGLPVAWEGRPWARVRGVVDEGAEGAIGVRIGARLTDLSLATRGRDSAAAGIARDVIALADRLGGARTSTADVYDVIARDGAAADVSAERLRGAARDLATRAPDGSVEIGAWLEAARVAVARRDRRFLA
ncbi:MAG: hypothetical protein ACXW0Z_07465, partial [Gemmatirosa sp.]